MRTLALLAACLLLALLAPAESRPKGADQADDEMQSKGEDHVAVISFSDEESTSLQDAGAGAGRSCYCRIGPCRFPERRLGRCIYQNRVYNFCC